ncbi:MAG TPA: PspC domain-containing protein [Streptosporangiaceae bacterium]|nr:PspC domain-containing protein [Streptosporangiaceae bacterium]
MSESNGHGTKRLYRRRDGRVVAGVCTGLAAYFGVDVTLIRLAFAVFTIFWGLGVLIYLVAWAVIPEEGEGASIVEGLIRKQH